MYVDKQLQEATAYKFGINKDKQPMAQVSYNGKTIATLAVPAYEHNVESAQRHIYSVVRSYIRMMNPSKA